MRVIDSTSSDRARSGIRTAIAGRPEKDIKVRLKGDPRKGAARATRKWPHHFLQRGAVDEAHDRGRKALSGSSMRDAFKNDAIRCADGSRARGCDAFYALASFEVRARESSPRERETRQLGTLHLSRLTPYYFERHSVMPPLKCTQDQCQR